MFSNRHYIEYLIATVANSPCSNLAEYLEGAETVSHDTIAVFLATAKFTPRGLWAVTLPLLYLQDGII